MMCLMKYYYFLYKEYFCFILQVINYLIMYLLTIYYFQGDCLWLGKQIDYFTSTVQEDLANQMNKYELRHHLAKSIFFIFAGVNDYGNKTNGNITARFTGPDFADFLFQKLTQQLQVHILPCCASLYSHIYCLRRTTSRFFK